MIRKFKENSKLIFILIVGFILRLKNVLIFPFFTDESIYIYWAKQLTIDHRTLLLPVWDGKTPLFVWITALLLKINIPYLFAGRFVSVIAGTITIYIVFLITKQLLNKYVALIAAFLYAINPFVLFYDRLALMESLMTLFGSLSCYYLIRFFQTKKYRYSIFIGISMGLAYLSKPTGMIFIIGLFTAFFLIRKKNDIVPLIKNALIAGILYFVISSIVKLSKAFFRMALKNKEFIMDFNELIRHPVSLIGNNFQLFILWMITYNGFLLIGVLVTGLFLLLTQKKYRVKSIFLLFYVVIPVLAICTVAIIIFPRYFVFIMPYIIILSAIMIEQLFLRNKIIGILVALILIVSWFRSDLLLITNFKLFPLPQTDKNQYFEGRSSGYGLDKLFLYIDRDLKNNQLIIVTDNAYGLFPYALELHYWEKINKQLIFLPTWNFDKEFAQKLNAISNNHPNLLTLFIFKDKSREIIEKNIAPVFNLSYTYEVKKIGNLSSFLVYRRKI